MPNYDFSGYVTRNDLRCSDGRTIKKDAFYGQDGTEVPLVWNHRHTDPENVLGHVLLENREDGVYGYAEFNDTESGKNAKKLVAHGDVKSLSIYANQLQQNSNRDVLHGVIREVSLVLAGANPGAFIDSVLAHSDGEETGIIVGFDENIMLYHADEKEKEPEDKKDDSDDETVEDVIKSMTEKQRTVMYALVGQALNDKEDESEEDDSKGEKEDMKHNVFDKDTASNQEYLSHADQASILNLAKSSSVGSLQDAISIYMEQKGEELAHGFDDIEYLFPEYKDVRPGAPELLQRDQGWVSVVMAKTHKSPISRIRTRQMDIRDASKLRAHGFKSGKKKQNAGNAKLLKRTTDPQTVYRKDALNRDDIIDITDFDVVEYQYGIMRQNLNEELAMAVMVGDGREEGDDYKIAEDHIRPIWKDDDLYCIHKDVDIAAAKEELQGTGTGASFGENYIYAEAIITAALYAREDFKGSGTPDFYCTPHLLNVMLLARDMNGRRIYTNKADLAAALNVGEIYTAEQFEGLTRTTSDNKVKKLLGLFVNLADYQIGATKGGEITKFNQFDIDFNQEKYLIETRVSGALTRVYSAIALEEDVTDSGNGEG